MGEGKTRTQASGKCYGMWRSAHGDAESLASQLAKQGEAAGKSPSDYDKEELELGTKVEMERTDEPAAARRIAMAHLEENPRYYSEMLIPAEKEAAKAEDVLRSAVADALPSYPKDHPVGMTVPPGGSNCTKCRFFNNEYYCSNARFQAWNKAKHGGDGSEIPGEPARYCCDFFMAPEVKDAEASQLLEALVGAIVRRAEEHAAEQVRAAEQHGAVGLQKELIKVLAFGGEQVKVYTVNGLHVRTAKENGGCGTMQFTMGMNGWAATDPMYENAPEWCAEDEVCLHNLMSPVDMLATMVHEVFERWAMKHLGMDYETAHETVANPAEEAARWLLATPEWTQRLAA